MRRGKTATAKTLKAAARGGSGVKPVVLNLLPMARDKRSARIRRKSAASDARKQLDNIIVRTE